MRLIYTGPAPTSFVSLGAELFPGQEFEAPDEWADAFLSRADISPAPVAAVRTRKSKTAPDASAPAAAEEMDDAIPDDH